MKVFYAAFALTVAGNVLYHLSQKSIAGGVHPIVSLIASYITAILGSLVILMIFPLREPVGAAIARLNWATLALGISIVAVELGYLIAYRAGWKVSVASVTSNTTVALVLLPIGLLMFREHLTMTNAIGLVLCVIGLVLVTR